MSSRRPLLSPPLLWMAPALSGGGYASEAIAFAQGLAPAFSNASRRFRLRQFAEHGDEDFMLGLPSAVSQILQKPYEAPNAGLWRGAVVCHSPPDAWVPSKFPGWDQLSPCPPPGAKLTIGRTMFETDSMPSAWVPRCNAMDSVWVPTEFHREAFARAGVLPQKLAVIGEPVDGVFFDPAATTPLPLPLVATGGDEDGAPFRFLAIFKWELRKGWDALLSAYFAEFEPSERVELVLKTRPFHSSGDFDSLIADFVRERDLPSVRAAVRILDQPMSFDQLRSLYAAAHAFVLPSRGEGWGRPHVEAMAMGLPVIATNWCGDAASALGAALVHAWARSCGCRVVLEVGVGGALPTAGVGRFLSRRKFLSPGSAAPLTTYLHPLVALRSGPTAFLDESVGYPLAYELVPVPEDLHLPGHHWAEPSVPHLRTLMRRIYTHHEEARARGMAARQRMLEQFSPEALADAVVSALGERRSRPRRGGGKEEL